MLFSESMLNNFKDNLVSESLHLPHGTKSAKLICHVDLDGVCSGISMVKQLEKQGIPNNRITIEFAQYGDEKKDSFMDKFEAKKGQYIGVTDYAKLPRAKPFDTFNKLMSFKGNTLRTNFCNFMLSKDFSGVSLEEFERMLSKEFKYETGKFTKDNVKKLWRELRGYYSISKSKRPEINPATIEKVEYQTVEPYFLSDHHSNELGQLDGGKFGELENGSGSEAEFIANRYAPGLWSKEDISAITMVDSAGYTEEQLKNTIFLEKHFTGPNKKKNLATIVACIYDNMVKKDKRAAKYVVLNSGPNLVSLYSTVLKAANMSAKSVEAFNLLKNGDVKGASEIINSLPHIFQKGWTDKDTYKNVKPIMGLEDWQKKNTKDLEDAKTGRKSEADEKTLEKIKGSRNKEDKETRDKIKSKKGKVFIYKNFSIFEGTSTRIQYSRYLPSLFSVDGKRAAFSMRYWNGFFQAAKSPLYKGEVNFIQVNKKVLDDIRAYLLDKGLGELKVDLIIKEMQSGNGGHSKAIWNFGGFDKIKPTSKELGDYYDKKEMLDRAAKVKLSLPNTEKAVNSKQEVLDKYSALRNDTMKYAMNRVLYWVNKDFPVSEEDLKKLETDDKTFEQNL